MSETKILVPYDEYTSIVKESSELNSIKSILNTEFPDDTCQLLAVKAILGMIVEEPEVPIEPDEPIVEPEPEDPDNQTTPPAGE